MKLFVLESVLNIGPVMFGMFRMFGRKTSTVKVSNIYKNKIYVYIPAELLNSGMKLKTAL